MNYIKKMVAEHAAWTALYIGIGVLCAALKAVNARFLQQVLDSLGAGSLTAAMLALYGGLMAAEIIANYAEEAPYTRLGNRFALGFQLLALSKMQTIDYRTYTGLDAAGLLQRIENGAAAGRGILFDFYLRFLCELLPAILAGLLAIAGINAAILPYIGAGYVIVAIVSHLLLKTLYRIKSRLLDHEELFHRLLVRGLMELVVFRTNRRYKAELLRARETQGEIVSAKVTMRMVHEAFFALFALLVIAIKIVVLLAAWRGGGALTAGAVVALLALMDQAYAPIAIANVLYVQYKLDKLAYARLTDFLDLPDDPRLLAGDIPAIGGAEVRLAGVSLRFGEKEVLRDFSCHMPAGAFTAIVGESGAGKSTLAKLVAGLIRPDAGRVLVDQCDIATVDLDAYYQSVVYLGQDAPIFSGSLRENLTVRDAVDDETLLLALSAATLFPFFTSLPDGLDTQLGDRGMRVSGGERQRIALARLFYSDAKLIVLDEATSALDAETERAVMERLAERLTGRTVIAIAHRESAIRGAGHTIRI